MKRYHFELRGMDYKMTEHENGEYYLCSEVDAALTAVREEVEEANRKVEVERNIKETEKKILIQEIERNADLKRERDAYRAVLVGCEFEKIDNFPAKGVAFALAVGKAASLSIKRMRQRADNAEAALKKAQEQNADLRGKVERLGCDVDGCYHRVPMQALAGEKVPDKKSPLMEAYDILIPEAGKEGGE